MWSFSRQCIGNASHKSGSDWSESSSGIRKQWQNCLTFSEYPTEDPGRFLSDFEAYCNNTDEWKLAAFQLNLIGPANTWYGCLDDDDKADWDNLAAAFNLLKNRKVKIWNTTVEYLR